MSDSTPQPEAGIRSTSALIRFFHAAGRVFRFLRVSVANTLVAILLVTVLWLFLWSIETDESDHIPVKAVLLVELRGALIETPETPDLIDLFSQNGEQTWQTPVQDLVDGLSAAAQDERIVGVALRSDGPLLANQAQVERIEAALKTFTDTDKPSAAHGVLFSQSFYRIASGTDVVSMDPLGEVFFQGFSRRQPYFAKLLENLSVKVNVFKSGTFKDAVEPFMLDSMSEESRAVSQELLDGFWSKYRMQIAENRGKTVEEFDSYIQNFPKLIAAAGGSNGKLALEHGWIDEVAILDKDNETLRQHLGDAPFVSLNQYVATLRDAEASSASQISVVSVTGTITPGKSTEDTIGSDSLTQALNGLAGNKKVKAVVLHVDSPGGSAYASEMIRRSMLRVKKKKPIVTYMAGVAASGGYWISAPSSEIWASPSTVTGSIGVFGILPTFEDSLEKIGISFDGVGTTQFSGAASMFAELSAPMGTVIQAYVDKTYSDFIDIVAEGRGLSHDDVRKIAEGRVWSGAEAQALGLVDELGSLNEAIESAAMLAKVENYQIDRVRTVAEPLERLLSLLGAAEGRSLVDLAQGRGSILAPVSRALASKALLARLFQEPRRVFALCQSCWGDTQ